MPDPNPNPEGPSTQYLRFLVPNTIKGMVLGNRDLQHWILGTSGWSSNHVVVTNAPGVVLAWASSVKVEASGRTLVKFVDMDAEKINTDIDVDLDMDILSKPMGEISTSLASFLGPYEQA